MQKELKEVNLKDGFMKQVTVLAWNWRELIIYGGESVQQCT